MEELVNNINKVNVDEFLKAYQKFINENGRKMTFKELNENDLREKFWGGVINKLSDAKYCDLHERCLEILRILSRDKTSLDVIVTDERLQLIIKKAELATPCMPRDDNVILESLKLLCNLLFNSPGVQLQIVKTPCIENLVRKISNYDDNVSHQMQLFDNRILFLVTALNVRSRTIVKEEYNGDKHLIRFLSSLCDKIINKDSNDAIEVACELLKTLFNLYIDVDDSTETQREENKKLVFIFYRLLTSPNIHVHDKDELQSHIVNLLTVMPLSCYSELIPSITSKTDENCEVYDNADMSAISALLTFLERRLISPNNSIESVSPAVTALLKLAQSKRLIRKYVRQRVLPPLREKDVMKRPEEGSNLRAELCQLLTSPLTELKDLVAEFLFVLCKENVARMIKYTGYGNAAGMFANKGLLGCKQPATDYSSESGESDTEEYAKYRPDINPVTGCYEKPKANPFEGMTEEQKEYEAMKLVNLVSQLTEEGIVKPCTIGEDGKPKPVEHVLELQENMPKIKIDDSDSD